VLDAGVEFLAKTVHAGGAGCAKCAQYWTTNLTRRCFGNEAEAHMVKQTITSKMGFCPGTALANVSKRGVGARDRCQSTFQVHMSEVNPEKNRRDPGH